MLAVYEKRMAELPTTSSSASTSSSSPFNASAHLGDFCSKDPQLPSSVELADYDIAAVGLGFHHFDNPELCLRRLAQTVKKGTGIVLILDWLPAESSHDAHGEQSNGHGHGEKGDKDEWQAMQKTVKHNGFDETTMRRMYEEAGLTDFGFEVLDEEFVLEPKGRRMVKRGFLARGRRL